MHEPGKKPPMGLEAFCKAAWPDIFHKPFEHVEIAEVATAIDLKRIARAVMVGGLHAVILEKGKGKTVLSIAAAMWVSTQGLRRLPLVVVPTVEVAAQTMAAAHQMASEAKIDLAGMNGIYVPFDALDKTASLRRELPRGKTQLPDLCILDDPEPDGAQIE